MIDVPRVLNEMLRVGRRGIVSFPNLGYHKLRRQLAEEGRAPLVAVGGGSRWYDTPNVRFLTIADFDEFCREQGIHVHQQVAAEHGDRPARATTTRTSTPTGHRGAQQVSRPAVSAL